MSQVVSALPREFCRIRLELARGHDFALGSSQDGYEMIAPLDRQRRIDAALWRAHPRACGVLRFRSDDADQIGHLVHRPGASWTIRCGGSHADDAGYELSDERFNVGEYISISDGNTQRTYRVVSVERL